MRKERGWERINNSKLAYSGLVSMLKIQIEIVNTGGSKESLPSRSQKCRCRIPQKCRASISSWLPCAAHEKDYPRNRKVCSPTGQFSITDTQPILQHTAKKKASKISTTQLEIPLSEWPRVSGLLSQGRSLDEKGNSFSPCPSRSKKIMFIKLSAHHTWDVFSVPRGSYRRLHMKCI